MFVQVVRGLVGEPDPVFTRLDLWLDQLAPGAAGWLGTTAGITRDGELVAFVRFASTSAARASSDRVEQGQWWAESAVVFRGDVSFDNYEDVTLVGDGGSDAAATVEVVLGRVHRRRRHDDLAAELGARSLEVAPDVIGGLVGLHDDGRLIQAVYFGSPPAHRCPDAAAAPAWQGTSAIVSDFRLLRLEDLWFGSPGAAVRRRSVAG